MRSLSTVFVWAFALPAIVAIGGVFSAPVVLAAQTECGTHRADIIQKAYPSANKTSDGVYQLDGANIAVPTDAGDDPHAVICRIWPARPELTLVAVPLMTAQSDDGNEGDIELLVVDSVSFEVKQRRRLEGLMSDDAVYVSSVVFDTARYQLAVGKTAFGLRLSLAGSSRPNPFGETTLWLFLSDDDGLKPVLDNIVVSESQGEWDTNCAGEFHETTRTLSMNPSAQKPFTDILVSEKETTTINSVAKNGECLDNEKTTTRKHRVVYEGSAYRVPKQLKRAE